MSDFRKHEPSDKNMDGTQDASHIGQLGCANRICGESGNLQRNTAPHCLQAKSRCENDNAGDLKYLVGDDGLKSKDASIQRFKLAS